LEIERTDFFDPKFSRSHFDLAVIVIWNALFLVKLSDEFRGGEMSRQRRYFVVGELNGFNRLNRFGGIGLRIGLDVRAISDEEGKSEDDK
jgi:hypothetical protein